MQVKELVSSELFAKYDKLLLQTGLDTMLDIVYCPRPSCQQPVILDRESSMGSCPSCSFVFCALCKLGYHGVSPCTIKAGLYILDLQLPVQSVPITSNVCTTFMARLYSIQHYVIKSVSDLRQVSGILWLLWFPPPIKLTATI